MKHSAEKSLSNCALLQANVVWHFQTRFCRSYWTLCRSRCSYLPKKVGHKKGEPGVVLGLNNVRERLRATNTCTVPQPYFHFVSINNSWLVCEIKSNSWFSVLVEFIIEETFKNTSLALNKNLNKYQHSMTNQCYYHQQAIRKLRVHYFVQPLIIKKEKQTQKKNNLHLN